MKGDMSAGVSLRFSLTPAFQAGDSVLTAWFGGHMKAVETAFVA